MGLSYPRVFDKGRVFENVLLKAKRGVESCFQKLWECSALLGWINLRDHITPIMVRGLV